jgi:hypothetical protein
LQILLRLEAPVAYVSMRQHTSVAFVRIRQHTSAYVNSFLKFVLKLVSPVARLAYVSIRQHTSANVSIRQHASAYVSIRQHASAYVSIPFARLVGIIQNKVVHVIAKSPANMYDLYSSAFVSMCQHTSAYVSIREHTSAYESVSFTSRLFT